MKTSFFLFNMYNAIKDIYYKNIEKKKKSYIINKYLVLVQIIKKNIYISLLSLIYEKLLCGYMQIFIYTVIQLVLLKIYYLSYKELCLNVLITPLLMPNLLKQTFQLEPQDNSPLYIVHF